MAHRGQTSGPALPRDSQPHSPHIQRGSCHLASLAPIHLECALPPLRDKIAQFLPRGLARPWLVPESIAPDLYPHQAGPTAHRKDHAFLKKGKYPAFHYWTFPEIRHPFGAPSPRHGGTPPCVGGCVPSGLPR